MGAEKEGIKNGGGYVGGFFQLFDWTSKSRKKLFATKSDISESLKQAKRFDGNLTMTRSYAVDENEVGVGSSDHSYASSVTDDEAYGARPAGVVARLMGLDSLPTSSFRDPYSTPFFDSESLKDAQYFRNNLNYQQNYHSVYSGNLLEKAEGHSRNFMERKSQKTVTSRPIEKFQTEVLPPKSAKSIPVTQHKLLSPIKSPGFIPTNNAAYIMEAAARIIEPGSQGTTKAKIPLTDSSTVSLKVNDLKGKMEASQKGPLIASSSMTSRARDRKEAREVSHRTTQRSEPSQRSVESKAARHLKGQSLNKSWNGSADTSIRPSSDREEDSSVNNKGKSISLAVQAKVNVQRREGLSSNGSRSLVGSNKHLEVKPNQPLETNVQRNLRKKSSSQKASGVLRPNNLKQNCSIDKDKISSNPLVSNSHGRKVLSGGRRRSSNSKLTGKSKAETRKSDLGVTVSRKEDLYTSTNNFPLKKQSTHRDWNGRVVDNLSIDKTRKPIQSNLVRKNRHSGAEEVRRKDMGVVSFTFTTPLTRNNHAFENSEQVDKNTNTLSLDHRIRRVLLDSDRTRSSVGYNVIGGDALGDLLEQKLRQWAHAVESSCRDSFKQRSPTNIASNSKFLIPSLSPVNLVPTFQQKDRNVLLTDKLCSTRDSDVFSPSLPEVTSKQKAWEAGETRSDPSEAQLFDCRHPSPISVLEHSFSTENCESSSVSTDATNSTEGSKLCPTVRAQEVLGLNSSRKFYPAEADTELSDSASSTSTETVGKKCTCRSSIKKLGRSFTWEFDFVNDILCNVELMFEDFASGHIREIVHPHLFNQLEIRKVGFEDDGGESRIRRKVIFDCVSECLDLRSRHYVGGGYKMWAKGIATVRRNELLAEEVYKEISGWGALRDAMVDELVDKDMSSQYGRWLDFDIDAFELGSQVGDQILNSLVDDVLADILQS